VGEKKKKKKKRGKGTSFFPGLGIKRSKEPHSVFCAAAGTVYHGGEGGKEGKGTQKVVFHRQKQIEPSLETRADQQEKREKKERRGRF